jgi:hypothetical protein
MSKPVDEAALLEALESALEDTIEVAWDQAVMMETYEPSGAATRKVQEDLGKYLAQLGKLDRLAMQMGDTDIAVHTNVIDKVDHGINPDLFTKEYLENCENANRQLRGKLVSAHVYNQVLGKIEMPSVAPAEQKGNTEQKKI